MSSKTEVIGSASLSRDPKDSGNVVTAWETTRLWLARLKLGRVPTLDARDIDRIQAAMVKARAKADFVADWDGKWLTISSRVGGTLTAIARFDLADGGVTRWRAGVHRLKAFTTLVTAADLSAFEQAHPDPKLPDPLRAQVELLSGEVRQLEDALEHKRSDLERARKALQARGGA